MKPDEIEPIFIEIGQRMRWLRQQRGWSAAKVAEVVGVSSGCVAGWETATSRPTVAALCLYAHACGAELTVFLADLDVEKCRNPVARERRLRSSLKRLATMKKNGTTNLPKKKKKP
jgi:transcriptional regulator with XRE-family HTH domain